METQHSQQQPLQPQPQPQSEAGLANLVVKLTAYQLHEHGLVIEDDDDAGVLADFADELLAARTNTSSPGASAEVSTHCGHP